jgi:Na+-transporting NADH:ubiquinone oxidoreductase subunit NqrD
MLDLIVTIGGIVYGVVLVSVAFFRNRFTEALRVDALFLPRPTEATRMLNPGIGLLLLAYNAYSLLR